MIKKQVYLAFIVIFALQGQALLAFCCEGDGCSNSLVQYVDGKGMPTGKYALLDENGMRLWIKKSGECVCPTGIGRSFPAKECPNCTQALCPDCGHDIFQHTCDLNVRTKPGTGIFEIRE